MGGPGETSSRGIMEDCQKTAMSFSSQFFGYCLGVFKSNPTCAQALAVSGSCIRNTEDSKIMRDSNAS